MSDRPRNENEWVECIEKAILAAEGPLPPFYVDPNLNFNKIVQMVDESKKIQTTDCNIEERCIRIKKT